MRGRPSVWWPTKAEPARFFDRAELARSDRYHRPLNLVALASAFAKLVGLVAAVGVAAALAGQEPAIAEGWRIVFGACLVAAAQGLPATAAEAWFALVHEPNATGRGRVPVRGFLFVSTASLIAMTAGLTVGAWGIYWLVGSFPGWRLAAIATMMLLGLGLVAAIGERWFGQLLARARGAEATANRLAPIGDDLTALVGLFDLPAIDFLCEPETAAPSGWRSPAVVPVIGHEGGGATAYTTGLGRRRRVVVGEALLDHPAEVRNFVIGHELAHVAGRHVAAQAALGLGAAVGFILGIAALMASGQPWTWFGLEPADPLGLPIVATLAVVYGGAIELAAAWLGRANERQADAKAATLLGVPPIAFLADLYQRSSADLNPTALTRWIGHHPPPAERLNFLDRMRERD